MSERVTVSPESVRGLGDIVSPKTTDDFKEYFCSVTEEDGVYTLVYDDTMSYLSLSGNPTVISYGESTVLTATLIIEGEPVSGETVSFYDTDSLSSEGVLIGSVETGSDGKAVLTKSDFSIGLHYVKAVYEDLFSGFVGVTVNKVTPTISLSSDKSSLNVGESFTLSGALSIGAGVTVKLYNGSTFVKDLTTGAGGVFSETVLNASLGSYSYKVVYEGSVEYEAVTSSTVNVTVNKIASTISLSSDKSAVFSGESFTLSGVLSVGSGETVKLYKENVFVKDLTTGTGGAFSETITNASSGDNNYKVVFEGDTEYESVTSSTVNVFVIDGDYIELGVTGSSFSTGSNTPLEYTGRVFVDWDDGNVVEYTEGTLSHTYVSSGNRTVKVYGEITSLEDTCFYNCTGLTSIIIPNCITSIGEGCFGGCSGLTSINIPNTVTSIGSRCFRYCTGLTSVTIPDTVTNLGANCFRYCTGLTEIVLEWDSSSEILTYDNGWIDGASSFSHFLIPEGTKSLYNARNYPSSLLKEVGSVEPASVDLTGTKSILSYADSESTVLTATVLDENDDPVEGVTVNLYNGATLWDTLTTDSSGECTKTYSSAGVGDITFTAEVDGTLLTKTYSIEDCIDYQPLTSNAHQSRWTIPSGVTSQYSSNGWRISADAYKQIKLTDKLTSECSVEFTISDYTTKTSMAVIVFAYTNGETTPSMKILVGGTSLESERKVFNNVLDHDLIKGGKYRIEYTPSTIKVYENNTLIGQANNTVGLPTRFEWHMGADSRYAIYKDLKVKPL